MANFGMQGNSLTHGNQFNPLTQGNQGNQDKPGFWKQFGEFFTGTPGRQQSALNPGQQGVQSQLLQQIMQIMNGQGGENPMSQQIQRNFQTNTIPGLSERFTALGGGAQNSSAFQGALGSAAGNLGLDLQAQQYNQLNNLLGHGLQQTENYIPRQPGALESLAGPAGQALLSYLSGGFSNLSQGQGWGGTGGATGSISDFLKQLAASGGR